MLAKLLFIFAITGHLAASIELPIVYLTWEDDPTTTMTIRWITSFKDRNDDVEYRKKQNVPGMKNQDNHGSLSQIFYNYTLSNCRDLLQILLISST